MAIALWRLSILYRQGCGLDCDLTFWAVQLLHLVENAEYGRENTDRKQRKW